MRYRSLGRTGVQVSRLCLGCMNFGGRTDVTESERILAAARDAGVNFIDTANVYGHAPGDFTSGRGRSEEIVGRALGVSRSQVVLATKMYFPMSDEPGALGSSRRNIIRECEDSLRRLNTDYIDLYQLHHPSNDVPIDETLRALDDLVRSGKVRYIGTSSFAAWQIVESLWASDVLGLNRVVSEQASYNLLDRRLERELAGMAAGYGVAILAWSPTAGGFLSGKYRAEAPPKDSRFAEFWKGAAQRHSSPGALAVLNEVERLAREKSASAYQIALGWVLHQACITSAIMGPRTLEQLNDALGAEDIDLEEEDLKALDGVAPPGRATVPYYGYDGMAWIPWGPHRFPWR